MRPRNWAKITKSCATQQKTMTKIIHFSYKMNLFHSSLWRGWKSLFYNFFFEITIRPKFIFLRAYFVLDLSNFLDSKMWHCCMLKILSWTLTNYQIYQKIPEKVDFFLQGGGGGARVNRKPQKSPPGLRRSV